MRIFAISVLSGIAFSASAAWILRDSVAYASDPAPNLELLRLRSDLATLEVRLYAAEMERCESLGVHPVPPPRKP